MRIVLLAVVLVLACVPAAGAAAVPPNDDFANAIDLTALADPFLQGTNLNATEEDMEPDHAGNPGGRSVWYSWTAPGDGSIPNVSFAVDGFDTLLGVYTGAAVGALTEVASNDDVGGGPGSAVSFATVAGETYRIAIDGFGGKTGRFFLSWGPAPPNDNFADAIALAGASGQREGDSIVGATAEAGEIVFAAPPSVWYSWSPPVDGTYKIDTEGSSFDTVLAVYEGTSLEDLELLEVNDDDFEIGGCCWSWVPLVDALAATTYWIQVSSFGESEGSITLNWSPLILGTNGADVITGTSADEEIRARGGNDVVRGAGGADRIVGGNGNDEVHGGPGDDLLVDRRGLDRLLGEGGADRLDTRDGRRGDIVNGGAGADVCRADRRDTRRNCP